MIIVPVTAVFVWISFRFTEESILENSQKYVSQLVEQVNDKVDFYLDYMDNTSWMLLFHSDVGDYLSREFTDDTQKKEMAAGIADQFSNILSTRSDIYCIAAYGQNLSLIHIFVLESMERTGTLELKDRLITELSGGQLQRVFLARVFAQDPQIILLDEPTNHLDLKYQIELIEYLKEWLSLIHI